MCGLSGIYNLDGKTVDENLLMRMNRTLSHRGPDDEGYYVNGCIGLGHRRLSIIDLNTGHQPVFNEDKSIAVVFNGEIYNFVEVRDFLKKKGHCFITLTDTEIIVHGYEEWGVDCVTKFRGMFAFVLWDEKRKVLFSARDRLGIKPLYYYYDAQKISFASEIKALLEDDEVERNLDFEALSDYFSLGYVPSPKSIFQKIYKLPPGHYLLYKNGSLQIEQYWDVQFDVVQEFNEKKCTDELISLLKESIKLRLVSDVPLGAFLSGGIDSSLVVALMAEMMDKPVITNSIGFSVQKYNELNYARQTSDYFKTAHHEFVVTPDAADVVEKLAWFYDEPFADSSAIPTYYVSKMTRQNVTVALSGDGGDENFAGYRRYYFDLLENQLRTKIPPVIRKYLIGAAASVYPKADWLPQVFRAKTLLTNLSLDPVSGYFNSMSMFLPKMKEQLFSNELKEVLKNYNSENIFRNHYDHCHSKDPLARIQYIDYKTYLPDDILTKVDRASMACSLEVRVPILDHKFVEFAATIPSNMKLRNKNSKFIFKQAAKKILPGHIISRKKMGFSIPVGEWMKKELKPLVQDLIVNDSDQNNFFNKQYIHQLWNDHFKGISDNTQPLWTLLSFKLWERLYHK
jgi:asparagine synthase (glutamine-hydrolysing)